MKIGRVFKNMSWIHRTIMWIGVALVILSVLSTSIRASQATSVEISRENIWSNGSVVVAAMGGEGRIEVKVNGNGVIHAYRYEFEHIDAARFIINISYAQPIRIEASTDPFSGATVIAASFQYSIKDILKQFNASMEDLGEIKLKGSWSYSTQLKLGKTVVVFIEVGNNTSISLESMFYPLSIGIMSMEVTIGIGLVMTIAPLGHAILLSKRTVKE